MMYNKNELFKVQITSIAYGGKGIAKLDGKVVFVEDVVDGDIVNIQVVSGNKNFLIGKVVNIVEPSKYRIRPYCHLANACGGCQFQFIEYNHQLEIKKKMVNECMQKIAGINKEVEKIYESPQINEFRTKIQLPLSQTKKSKRILSGYYQKNSHELTNIKFCPIQPDIINKITEYFKLRAQELDFRVYDEKSKKGYLRHLVYRYSQKDDTLTLTIVVNSNSIDENLKLLSGELKSKFPQLVGICVNFNTTKSNLILSEKYEKLTGEDYIIENLLNKSYKVSVGSFFQVNPKSAEHILSIVKNEILKINSTPNILDCYAGVGTFSIFLSDIAKNIFAIENSKSSIDDFRENIKINNCKNIELVCDDAKNLLNSTDKKFDIAIIDPPRKGCDSEVLDALSNTAQNIVYVSCNPSTLARDTKILTKKYGYNLFSINCVDMFPNTYHVETICIFRK